MNLVATTNDSDDKIELVVFSSSSGSAFRHTVKPSKESTEVWNLIMKLNFRNKWD